MIGSHLKNYSFANLAEMFFAQVGVHQSKEALIFKSPGITRYESVSWTEWGQKVKQTALGLKALGIKRGDKIAILSENRPEWTFADLGILSLGAVTVPIYPTLLPEDIGYILNNAKAAAIFVSGTEQGKKIDLIAHRLPLLKHRILFDSDFDAHNLTHLTDLWERGRCAELNNETILYSEIRKTQTNDLATIIYTSGTTGAPKGVMLTHENFLSNIQGAAPYIPVTHADISLSFLPLSHVFERLAGYYFMIANGASIAYAESMQSVADDIKRVKPTVAAAVPRFYEKVYAKVLSSIEAGSPIKKLIFNWSLKVGSSYASRKIQKKRIPITLIICRIVANMLVFKKIKKAMGGRIRFFISGGAPLNKTLAEFFYTCGVLILEGYGLTETAPVIAANPWNEFRFGTVGKVLPNVKLKIADDGEILVSGPSIMAGYFDNETATREVMKDGWFSTGDIGSLDEEGYLSITDRKKDIIVTSGGKNIAPQNIENLILSDAFFSQAVVLGDKKNYLVALLVPNKAEAEKTAREAGISAASYEELLKNDSLCEIVRKRVDRKTGHLPKFEQIKYFALCPKEFTLDNGELTPTLKVKRRVIMKNYADIIEALYKKGEKFVPAS